jgi:hypothetical protein
MTTPISKPHADHFSSDNQYSLVKRHASRMAGPLALFMKMGCVGAKSYSLVWVGITLLGMNRFGV